MGFLVLKRERGESVKIGDDTTVTVLGISGGQVKLGFEAPKQKAIHREEVYNRINDAQANDDYAVRVQE